MARTAVTLGFTVAGAAVGAYFGAPMLGAQLGMMVGSIAGALLFPGGEDQKGPRLGDLRIGDASYGVPIPIVYGTARVAGTMIWTSGIEERSHEESMKGGGPTSTTYNYYSSFAIGLCEGPIDSVRKIWLDTKLVYDVSQDNTGIINQRTGEQDPRGLMTPEELAKRRGELQSELAKVQSSLSVYIGSDTQLPDPVMEAHEGAGEVPAHRGMAYLLFADLPLAAYGNRIPNVGAEVLQQSTFAYPAVSLSPAPTGLVKDDLLFDTTRQILWSWADQTILQLDALSNTIVRTEVLNTTPIGGGILQSSSLGMDLDVDGALYAQVSPPSANRLVRIDPLTLQITHVAINPFTGLPANMGFNSTLRTSQMFVWWASLAGEVGVTCAKRPGAIDLATGVPITVMMITGFFSFDGPLVGMRGQFIAIDRDERAWVICSGNVPGTYLVHMDPVGNAEVIDLSADLRAGTLLAYDSFTHSLICAGYTPTDPMLSRVLKFDIDSRTVTLTGDNLVGIGYQASAWRRGIVGRALWVVDGSLIQSLDVDSLTITRSDVTDGTTFPNSLNYGGLYDPSTHAFWTIQHGSTFGKFFFDRTAPQPVTLGTIVRDLSLRAGLASADVFTEDLTEPVHGFVVSQRSEARASVEPLLAAFLADGVETDWHIEFQHRALLPAATLTANDLAAHEPGSTLPDVLTPERLDDQQIPIRLDVTYADPARDYQESVKHARRFQAGQRARSQREVRTPVILSADQAKQLAEQSLAEAWVSRSTYKLATPYRWSTLDPGDVLEVQANGATSLMRVQQIQHGANGILEMTAVAYDRHIYTASVSVGVLGDAVVKQTITMNAPTVLFLMDTHLLRDVDEGSGYYMAMAPQGSGEWSGATAFSSLDGQAWRMEDTITSAVSYGGATSVLAVGSPYVIDYGHTVDIRMARGTLSSISELEMLNGQNAALLGNEIVQWQTATALDATSWRLSNLLRGRRGTDWAIGTHQVGERFIVLAPTPLRREQMGLSEVGAARAYRAVTNNTDMLATYAQSFTNTALGLKCYSPEHVTGTRTTGNDLTITWKRRTRLGGQWADGHDVPLGEASEQYSVDILDGADIVRTIDTTVQSATYLASEQTTDGLTPGNPVTVTVYQLGTLGRGWPTTATV